MADKVQIEVTWLANGLPSGKIRIGNGIGQTTHPIHSQFSVVVVFPVLFFEQLLRPLEVGRAVSFPRAAVAGQFFQHPVAPLLLHGSHFLPYLVW